VSPKPPEQLPTEPDYEWLPQEPPPLLSRLTGWLVIVLFAGTFIAAATIALPETVRCRFRLIPASGADPLQSPLPGTLFRVLVTEGAEVEAGAPLFEIRSEEILAWQTGLQTALEDLRAGEESALRTEEAHQSLLKMKEAEREQVEQERRFRERHRETVADLVRRTRELQVLKLVSEVEMLRVELELANADKDLNVTAQALQRLVSERARMESDRARQRSDERAAQEKWKHTIASLRLRLVGTEGAILTIRAPHRAVVLSVAQHTPGSVVQPGHELCQLARTDDPPLADLQLRQEGLDRLVQGQETKLFFDAFPYQRYGTLPGRIGWLSPSAITTAGSPQFRARAALDRTGFDWEGRAIPVRAGMVGEARIRVGSRTVLETMFEPLRALREEVR
jgi:multidrug efflux pump subunit AcrA (membrane-fusion protein)